MDPTFQAKSDRYADRLEIKRVEDRFALVCDKMTENMKTLNLKTERLMQKVSQMEQKFEAAIQENRSKYAALAGKMTERGLADSELGALLERHNQIVRNFETRMIQMQKLVEYQQLQIMNANAALEEARREFGRLKKI